MKRILPVVLLVNLMSLWLLTQSQEELNQQLFQAVKEGNLKQVKELVMKGAHVNARYETNANALIRASFKGYLNIVKFLVKNGAAWDEINPKYGSPVSCAIAGGHINIVDYFLTLGFDINKKHPDGTTLLHRTVIFNKKNIAELLIQKGAAINEKDTIGKTPLFYSIAVGCKEIEQLLIDKGAKIEEKERIKALAQFWHNKGKKAFDKKDFETAAQYYQKALELEKSSGKHQRALIGSRIGYAYYNLEQYKKALPFVKESLRLSQELDLPKITSSSSMLLGLIYKHLKNLDKAIGYFEQALNLGEDLGIKETCKVALANLWKQKGQQAREGKKYREALDCFQQSLKYKPHELQTIVSLAACFPYSWVFFLLLGW